MNRYEIWDQGYRCRVCICLSYVMLKGRRQVWVEGWGYSGMRYGELGAACST